MTDEHEAVRRALADARHTGPVPDDVVARLDATLARLAVEEPPGAQTTEPTVLRPRRWRRTVATVVGVAASLVIGGVVAQQALRPPDHEAPTADRADRGAALAPDTEADTEAGAQDDTRDGADSEEKSTLSDQVGPPDAHADSSQVLPQDGYATIRPDHLSADVRRAVDEAGAMSRHNAASAAACDVRPELAGRRVPVLLADRAGDRTREGVLVERIRAGGGRVVTVLACGDGAVLDRLTLP